ncbi:MAG: SDR family oxidoreductase [Bacteroidales bacterium]|nr:SDR family oxidoreductase [Bacteroidales bacterium]
MEAKKILVAGATGYLGKFITQELLERDYETKIIVRNKNKLKLTTPNLVILEAEVTKPETLKHICKDVDVVISTIGITRQKDGLTYMDVDYKANANLIDEAKKNGVKKFIYISVLNGEKLRHLKICEAKEKLGDYLKSSGLDYCIIRPNGFFSDMGDFLKMAKSGKVYLFGDGKLRLNPIHGKDLAKEVVNAINQEKKEINIGGPDLLSQNEIAELALKAYGKAIKIVHLPDWIRKFALWSIRKFTSSKAYGPIEFFMTTMVMNMEAPQFGQEKLEDFFNEEAKK